MNRSSRQHLVQEITEQIHAVHQLQPKEGRDVDPAERGANGPELAADGQEGIAPFLAHGVPGIASGEDLGGRG